MTIEDRIRTMHEDLNRVIQRGGGRSASFDYSGIFTATIAVSYDGNQWEGRLNMSGAGISITETMPAKTLEGVLLRMEKHIEMNIEAANKGTGGIMWET